MTVLVIILMLKRYHIFIFLNICLVKEFQTSDMEIIQNNINTELFEKNENNFNLSSDF